MMLSVEPAIARYMHDNKITYVDISQNRTEMSLSIEPVIRQRFIEETGLQTFGFTIATIQIDEREIMAIEDELQRRKDEIRERKEAKEIAEELERIQDKEWEREIYLKQLEQADRDK